MLGLRGLCATCQTVTYRLGNPPLPPGILPQSQRLGGQWCEDTVPLGQQSWWANLSPWREYTLHKHWDCSGSLVSVRLVCFSLQAGGSPASIPCGSLPTVPLSTSGINTVGIVPILEGGSVASVDCLLPLLWGVDVPPIHSLLGVAVAGVPDLVRFGQGHLR